MVSVAGALAVSFVAAGCTGDDADPPETTTPTVVTTTPAEAATDRRLTIGMLLPSTGSGAALFGTSMRSAIEAAVNDINAAGGVLGRSVRLLDADEAHPGGFDELIAAGADAIVGPASSLVALAELDTALDAGVVVCSPTATALALDDYPDDDVLFFRTVPSDSLQMEAIVREVRDTGVESVSVAYLDDQYGRGLAKAFESRVNASAVLELDTRVGFPADQENLGEVAEQLAASRAVVVLANADDGGRLLTALDSVIDPDDPPTVVVNDAVRSARQPISQLSDALRSQLIGVAPRARSEEVDGFFAANAVDCVNLIALAVAQSGSDRPADFSRSIAVVSFGGSPCKGFAECAQRLAEVPQIDYTGLSGPVDLRGLSGDLTNAVFDVFGFDEDGTELEPRSRQVGV